MPGGWSVSRLLDEARALSDDALAVAGEIETVIAAADVDLDRLDDLLALWVAIGHQQDVAAAALFGARWVR